MRLISTFLAILLLAAPAEAHVGISHVFSFSAGFNHPLSGLDHFSAMIAVGLWAALAGGPRIWVWPAAFVAAMLFGGALAHEGVAISYTEPAIAASVVILGIAIALLLKLPTAAGAALIALFGVAHGYAHGLEAPETGWAGYAAGFTLATAALHFVGIGIGVALARLAGSAMARAMGAMTAAIGLFVFAQQ